MEELRSRTGARGSRGGGSHRGTRRDIEGGGQINDLGDIVDVRDPDDGGITLVVALVLVLVGEGGRGQERGNGKGG